MNNSNVSTPIGVDHEAKMRKHKAITPMSKINEGIPRLDTAFKNLELITLIPNTSKFFAQSKSDKTKQYHGDYEEGTCECPDHVFRGAQCWHIRGAKQKALQKNSVPQEPKLTDLIDKSLLLQ